MGFAEDALKLFITDNQDEINKLTNKLNEYNKKRQDTEKSIIDEALKQIKENEEEKKNIIVLSKDNWHHGVIRYSIIKNYRYLFKTKHTFM